MPAEPSHIVPIDRSSALPLWAQVQADIERRLHSGEFDEGFPGEMRLVRQYDVSRQTVRAALRTLRESGLVVAGRGRAPQVAGREIAQPQGTLYSLFSSVEGAGHRQRSIVGAFEVLADPIAAGHLGEPGSTPLVHLERVRLVDEEPLAMDRVWLPARIASPLLTADFTNTSLYHELDTRCGVRLTGGHEDVHAVLPSRAERDLLEIDDDVAVFGITRLGEVDGRPVEWRETRIRGDRFSFVSDLRRADGPSVSMSSSLLRRTP